MFHGLGNRCDTLSRHIPEEFQGEMDILCHHPTPGEIGALEALLHFGNRLLESGGRGNGNKGTYHHWTRFLYSSGAPEEEQETETALCQASSKEIIEHDAPATRQAFQLGQWLIDIEETKTQETNHQREQRYWDGTVRQQHAGYFVDDNR